jgi:hypothetical protein
MARIDASSRYRPWHTYRLKTTMWVIERATGWAQHTVRGFFAGLKKRQGITVEIAERIRQVGPNKQGAKGSYTVYRVAE